MAYTLTGEKCGTVRLDPKTTGIIITESVQRTSKVTSNPVEQGANITDHVVADPLKFTITGVTIGGDAQAAILRRMWQENDILDYVGKNRIQNCVITSYKSDIKANNKGGESFTLQLQVVNISSSEYVATGAKLMSKQDATASSTGGGSGGGGGGSRASQQKATSSAGQKSQVNSSISSSAYAQYVKSYNSKAKSSSGPSSRKTSAYSAA